MPRSSRRGCLRAGRRAHGQTGVSGGASLRCCGRDSKFELPPEDSLIAHQDWGGDTLKALITGITGFVGSHLVEYLLGQGVEVMGVADGEARLTPGTASLVKFYRADLREREPIALVLKETRPDLVFHLAAQAHVPTSWADPASTLIDNVLFQLNLFLGILHEGLDPFVLIPGSIEEYGYVKPGELPVREENPLRPTNPYAVSKVSQDMLAYQYSLTHDLKCVRMRAFNHTGPRQASHYVVPALAKQVAEAEAGLVQPEIRVGNLEAKRDFTDVRDVVRAYHLALLRCEPGEVYNLGSGRAVSIRQVLDFYLAQSRVPLTVVREEERMRPWDVPEYVCDATKFRSRTGWQPLIPLEQTLADVLDYWRQQVAGRHSGRSFSESLKDNHPA